MKSRPQKSRGFALVMALVLLLVITVLGVTSIRTVTLQERMASNLREKERADEASYIAIRAAERAIAEQQGYPTPGVGSGDDLGLRIYTLESVNSALGVSDPSTPLAYASDDFWEAASTGLNYGGFEPDEIAGTGLAAPPQSFLVESYRKDLQGAWTPASQGGSRTAKYVYYYDVTGRGVGGNLTAVSVNQSVYGKIF